MNTKYAVSLSEMVALITDKTIQEARKESMDQDYALITLGSSGKDCDGFLDRGTHSYLVKEDEAQLILANHFGLAGWVTSKEPDHLSMHRHDETEEGYWNTSAFIRFPEDAEACARCEGSGMAGYGGLMASESECGKCRGTGERRRA